MTTPDCPFCDDDMPLHAERAEPRGVKVCVCKQCHRRIRVNADGHTIGLVDVAVQAEESAA